MAIFYVIGCLIILGINYDYILPAIQTICKLAFTPGAAAGGLVGMGIRLAMQYGIARGLSQTNPVWVPHQLQQLLRRQEIRSVRRWYHQTGTFWDTVVVCLMTGLVLVSTIMKNPNINADLSDGETLTTLAFGRIPY